MKKKILFIYPEMMVGGSTTSLLALLNRIDLSRYEVDLILYKSRGELLADIPAEIHLLPQGSKYAENQFLPKVKKTLLLLMRGYLSKAVISEWKYHRRLGLNLQVMADAQGFLSRKLEKDYDVGIGFLELWSHAYLLQGVQAKKKIGWVHVDYEKAGYVSALDQERFNEMDHIACVSKSCRESLEKAFPDLSGKFAVVENLLSADYIREKAKNSSGISYDGFKIITVCRLVMHTKGLDRIVETAKKLRDEGWRFRWYIVGEGQDRPAFLKLIEKRGLKDYVILLGLQLNPYGYIKSCDLFVLPSRNEGKPMSVTEAQILGVPTIVTNYVSAREQVADGLDGLIVDNQKEESLYRAIRGMLDRPERIETMKGNLKQKDFIDAESIRSFYELIH